MKIKGFEKEMTLKLGANNNYDYAEKYVKDNITITSLVKEEPSTIIRHLLIEKGGSRLYKFEKEYGEILKDLKENYGAQEKEILEIDVIEVMI